MPYCPLSYSWGRNSDGDASLTHEITVGGHVELVTETLYDGLVELQGRSEQLGNVFWIDALCINQTDNQERTAQVAIIGQIYAHGGNTVVWLGRQETEDEDIALQALNYFEEPEDRFDDDDGLISQDKRLTTSYLLQLAYHHRIVWSDAICATVRKQRKDNRREIARRLQQLVTARRPGTRGY